jgi:hypothetical protein
VEGKAFAQGEGEVNDTVLDSDVSIEKLKTTDFNYLKDSVTAKQAVEIFNQQSSRAIR